jgi:hypothetical protein
MSTMHQSRVYYSSQQISNPGSYHQEAPWEGRWKTRAHFHPSFASKFYSLPD